MNHQYKVTIIGDTNVGKSSMITRLIRNKFELMPVTTIGAAFNNYRVPSDKTEDVIELHIWDTAGQERYKCLVPLYVRGTHAVVMVYAVDNKESKENLIKQWYPFVREHSDVERIYICGNKVDMGSTNTIEHGEFMEGMKRVCPKGKFFVASAKLGYGVKELFDTVAQDLHESDCVPLNSSLINLTNNHSLKKYLCCSS